VVIAGDDVGAVGCACNREMHPMFRKKSLVRLFSSLFLTLAPTAKLTLSADVFAFYTVIYLRSVAVHTMNLTFVHFRCARVKNTQNVIT